MSGGVDFTAELTGTGGLRQVAATASRRPLAPTRRRPRRASPVQRLDVRLLEGVRRGGAVVATPKRGD